MVHDRIFLTVLSSWYQTVALVGPFPLLLDMPKRPFPFRIDDVVVTLERVLAVTGPCVHRA